MGVVDLPAVVRVGGRRNPTSTAWPPSGRASRSSPRRPNRPPARAEVPRPAASLTVGPSRWQTSGTVETMRIVFMGSGAFAIPSLEALIDAGHEVVAAV